MRNNSKTLETTLIERKDYSQEMQKMIDVVKVRSSIERQENNNRKDDIIETIQKMKLDGDKEKGIIRKGIVKEMLERIKRQQGNSTLTNSKDGTLRKDLNVERDKKDDDLNLVNKERSMEKHNSKETRTLQPIRRNMEENDKLELFDKDSVVKVVNRKEKKNDAKKGNSFKEEIDERLNQLKELWTILETIA